MQLPFIAHLRHRVLGYEKARLPLPRFSDAMAEWENSPPTHDAVLRVEAHMFFTQRISQPEMVGSRGAEALAMAKERAVRAIAAETFGPIERELRDILTLLWEDGMAHSEAAKRIDAMLPILRGERSDG